MNGETSDVLADQFYLAGVNPSANREPEPGDRLPNCAGTANCAGGTVEHGKKSIAGGLNLAPAKAVELTPRLLVVFEEQLVPGGVAQAPQMRGRIHNIRAEQRGEHAIPVGGRSKKPRTRELDCLEGFVADYQSIVTGENVIDVVDPDFVCLAYFGLDSKSSPQDHTLVMDLAGAGLSDWTDIARPAPARLQVESPDRGFVVGYSFYPTVREAANFFWIAKTLCPGSQHGIH